MTNSRGWLQAIIVFGGAIILLIIFGNPAPSKYPACFGDNRFSIQIDKKLMVIRDERGRKMSEFGARMTATKRGTDIVLASYELDKFDKVINKFAPNFRQYRRQSQDVVSFFDVRELELIGDTPESGIVLSRRECENS